MTRGLWNKQGPSWCMAIKQENGRLPDTAHAGLLSSFHLSSSAFLTALPLQKDSQISQARGVNALAGQLSVLC